jgi:hypothetical protein
MKVSNEVYNCLVNQAIVMKHDSDENGNDIANKVVEEYLRGDELTAADKNELISKISYILRD